MNKYLVATRSDEEVATYTQFTHPILQNYAEKVNADFKILHNIEDFHKHHRIFQLYDLLKDYERIIVMDSDILITKDCPNLFDFVDYNEIGTVYEDVGTRRNDRRNRIAKIQSQRIDVGWREGYINTGVFVCSNIHRDLFKVEDPSKLWLDLGYDDVELGYRLNKMQIEVQELSPNFNFMSLFTNLSPNMTKSCANIIHYAGNGFNQWFSKSEQIKHDYLLMKKYNMVYGS